MKSGNNYKALITAEKIFTYFITVFHTVNTRRVYNIGTSKLIARKYKITHSQVFSCFNYFSIVPKVGVFFTPTFGFFIKIV